VKRLFMLDTHAVRALLERRSPELDRWFCEERCCISAIVAAEIGFGLERRRLSPARHQLVQDLLDVMPVEPFARRAAVVYGQLRTRLQASGTPLAAMDLLIAAHAFAVQRTLVSDDRAFTAVPELVLAGLGQLG